MTMPETAAAEPRDTKLKLLLAAERLFALQGIDAVSLRQITLAAGQRNESALHYHFGSREALIEAVFALRMSAIDARRNAMLDRFEAEGTADDLRALVAAIVWPLSTPIRDGAGPNYYNRFLAQAQQSPTVDIDRLVRGKYDSGIQRILALLARLLDGLPERLFRQRVVSVVASLVYGIADIEQVMAQRREQGREFDVDRAIENLIDMAAAALAAPVSPATRARLEAGGEPGYNSGEETA